MNVSRPSATGQRGYPGAAQFVPGQGATLAELAGAVAGCRGCDLYQRATQAVFGRGQATASVVLIGEQPGDAEDRAGEPFVGPAGRVLDRALREAGIGPEDAYTTNAVKHFRWKPDPRGGKRRIHERPDTAQLRACRPWLDAELTRLDPRVLVTLGATAGQALFGSGFRVGTARGTVVRWPGPASDNENDSDNDNDSDGDSDGEQREIAVVPTIHPSAVLRADDRDEMLAGLIDDLRVAASTAGLPGR